MDRQQAKRYVKERLEEYLIQRGLNPKKPFHCLNPEHPDQNPSMSLDRRRHKVHCFACGADYDTFDLIGLEEGLTDPVDIFRRAYERFQVEVDGGGSAGPAREAKRPAGPGPKPRAATGGIQRSVYTDTDVHTHMNTDTHKNDPDYGDYFQQVQARLEETGYWARRGLSLATARRFGLGFDPEFRAGGSDVWGALIIPTGPGSFTARNTDPEAEAKRRIRKRGASPLFNAGVLWESKSPIFVVEGEIDALSLEEVGGPAVALGSTANVGAFLKVAESRPPAQPLLLALDNDEGGRRASEALKKGLTALSLPFYEVAIYGDHKDANEALEKDYWTLVRLVHEASGIEEAAREAERRAYLDTSALRHLDRFRGGQDADLDTPPMPTGFAAFDGHLDGGLYEGLYIMGGISSLGKTSLALQMADQLAEGGRDVLIFSLEMARTELLAKSLSRLTLLNSLDYFGDGRHALTARSLTRRDRRAAWSASEAKLAALALDNYENFAGRLFICEGVGDFGPARVRREVDKHLHYTGRRPAVFVDYLQILAPADDRATDKRNTDLAVLELKRLSRDYQLPVVALSSFNRANYREAVTMEAFKESGAIEYSSDVLIGLQLKGAGEKDFDAAEAKEKNPREVELVILKNRHGPAGRRVVFEYYPLFNYFRETNG